MPAAKSSPKSSAVRATAAPRSARKSWSGDIWAAAFIFLLFFLHAGSPTPDVNEAHYLVKAKHFWNPQFCAGDVFCESADAHAVFYFTLGWLTRFCSLPAAAWIGRAITWAFLAVTWTYLCRVVFSQPIDGVHVVGTLRVPSESSRTANGTRSVPATMGRWGSWLAAGTALALWQHGHMAGEWVVGGVEAKGLAYGFVFWACAEWARERPQRAILLSGCAAACHVLVGGWTLVAFGFAWLLWGRSRPAVKTLLPYVIAAVIIALPGWYPALALSRGVDAATVREAARIYAYERLGHHLVFHRFAHAFLLRHAALVIVLGLLWRYGNPTPGLWRLYGVCAGAVAIALVGVVVDQSLLYHPDIAAGLLRYYFFRLTDALVPVGVALGVVAMVLRWESTHPKRYVAGIIALLLVSGSHLGNVALQRQRERLPPAVVQSLPRSRAPAWRLWEESVDEDALPPEMPPPVEAPTMELSQPPQQRIAFNTAEQRSDWHQQWLATCQWIRAHTQPTDRFLTCRSQQTFKWYAQRPEVANWKDVPQDARSLVAWHAAWNELHPPENGGQDLAGHTDERLRELVAKYDVQYLVIDRSRSSRVLGLQRVYPLAVSEATLFAVYRVEQESNAAPVTVRRETGYPIGK